MMLASPLSATWCGKDVRLNQADRTKRRPGTRLYDQIACNQHSAGQDRDLDRPTYPAATMLTNVSRLDA
jgi:hypothetical protein